MQVVLTADEAATLKQFRRLEADPALAKALRNQFFRTIKARYKIADDVRLRVNLDTEVDPLYGVLLNAGTGEPIDDGVLPLIPPPPPVGQRTGIWRVSADVALAALNTSPNAELAPGWANESFRHIRVPTYNAGYIYFPAK